MVGRTENSRPEGAVHFAARPRREAGYIAGLDADRPGQFSLGENVHHSATATTVLPPPLLCRRPRRTASRRPSDGRLFHALGAVR